MEVEVWMEGLNRWNSSSVPDPGRGSAADGEMKQDAGVMNAHLCLPRLMLSVQTPGGMQGACTRAHVSLFKVFVRICRQTIRENKKSGPLPAVSSLQIHLCQAPVRPNNRTLCFIDAAAVHM